MRSIYTNHRAWIWTLLALVPVYFMITSFGEIELDPGHSRTMWVRSQNGNDISAQLNVGSAGKSRAKLKYSIEKYAEIGIIDFPDMDTLFPSFLEGTKIRDFKTAPFADGLTIVDHNKTSAMNGVIPYWDVVSKESENEVQLVVFRYAEATRTYQIVQSSRPRVAKKGVNTFFEQVPLGIRQNDILGLIAKRPIASNRVLLNEMARVLTLSGHRSSFNEAEATWDSGNGSFSYSALLAAGSEQGEISGQPYDNAAVKLPQEPVYGSLARYKFIFTSETGVARFQPSLASLLLNADAYIGLTPETTSPWSPQAFSLALLVALAILLRLVAWLISPQAQDKYRLVIAIAAILAALGVAKGFAFDWPSLQFVAIIVSFILVFLLPGIVISRYFPFYGNEAASGRIVLAFVLSLVYWILPAFGLFVIKTSYWPVIAAAVLLIALSLLKQPIRRQREVFRDELSPTWTAFRFAMWGLAAVLAAHTLFSSRFHAESFDTFHHLSLAANNFELPIAGDRHTNLHDVSMRSIAPYSYNYWGLLVGMVVKISGLDIGTVYCVGSSLLVLLMFVAQWWLIGLIATSEKQRIGAFAFILMIYLTRSLGIFAPMFQRSEFSFTMYGPSVLEFFLYAVYLVLGIRAIRSGQRAELLMFCGLSIATAFFHMEFIFFNCMVLSLLIALSLRKNGKFDFGCTQVYLLSTICWLVIAGAVIKSQIAVGRVMDAESSYYSRFYALRYAEYGMLDRFYYLSVDLISSFGINLWNSIAIWGGALLVIFRRRNGSAPLFRTAYLVILLMLLISFNPIAEMIFTPLMTSWPLQRIPIYLRAITFTFAAIVLSIGIAYIVRIARNGVGNAFAAIGALLGIVPLLIMSDAGKWMPQIGSAVYTTTYNQGNYLDIAAVANLPEVRYLNEYSRTKHAVVLAEKAYSYAIPSLTHTYAYYHSHYQQFATRNDARELLWAACLDAERKCSSQLPDDSLILTRNGDLEKFKHLGYRELFRGRLFTVLKV